MRKNSLLQRIFVEHLLCDMVLGTGDTVKEAFKVTILMKLMF